MSKEYNYPIITEEDTNKAIKKIKESIKNIADLKIEHENGKIRISLSNDENKKNQVLEQLKGLSIYLHAEDSYSDHGKKNGFEITIEHPLHVYVLANDIKIPKIEQLTEQQKQRVIERLNSSNDIPNLDFKDGFDGVGFDALVTLKELDSEKTNNLIEKFEKTNKIKSANHLNAHSWGIRISVGDPIEIYHLATDFANPKVRLYSAAQEKDGKPRLAIKFDNQKQRDNFFLNMSEKTKEFDSAKLLSKMAANPEVLYIEPSIDRGFGTYISANGELSVNFGNNNIRDYFVQTLGIESKHATIPEKNKRGDNALYFDKNQLPAKPDRNKNIESNLSKSVEKSEEVRVTEFVQKAYPKAASELTPLLQQEISKKGNKQVKDAMINSNDINHQTAVTSFSQAINIPEGNPLNIVQKFCEIFKTLVSAVKNIDKINEKSKFDPNPQSIDNSKSKSL